MITITINPQTAAQMGVIAEVLKGLMEGLQPPATPPSREEMDKALKVAEEIHHKAEAPKVVKAPKPEPVQKTETAAPTPAAEEPAPQEVAPAAPATESHSEVIDYAAVKAAVLGLVKAQGNEAAAKVLSEFGVTKGPDLQPSQYAAVLARVKELS